jgi:hypothetical protein
VREATIKYHKIFRFHFEKFLLLMHDIYEIIMFPPILFSLQPPALTAFRIRSNRDNMNFSFFPHCFPWKCFLRDSIIRFLDFLSLFWEKSLSELRRVGFSLVFLSFVRNWRSSLCKFRKSWKFNDFFFDCSNRILWDSSGFRFRTWSKLK